MYQNVTFIDDLLDLDDPVQNGAFNKINNNKTSIKTLPEPFAAQQNISHGQPIDEPIISTSQHSGQRMRPGIAPPRENMMNTGLQHGPPGMQQGPPGMQQGPPGMHQGHPGMQQQHPGMQQHQQPQGMHPGMQQGPQGHPGMQHPSMQHPGMQSKESFRPKIIQPKIIENYKNELSCREIADHVSNCPICSKLYRQKRTGYIIAIIVLVIINLILLNRVVSTV